MARVEIFHRNPVAVAGPGVRPQQWAGAYGFDKQGALGSLFIASLTQGSRQCVGDLF